MLDDKHRKLLDVSEVAQNLAKMHEYVTRHDTRIEITHPGSDARCVLLSKRELDALERALAILSDTDDVRHITEKLAQLAAVATAGDFATAS